MPKKMQHTRRRLSDGEKRKKMGLIPDPNPHRGSIGFSEKEQKWYGWSHRAMYGFGIGDTVKAGDVIATAGDRALPVGFTAKTLEDARRMAEAFSEAVS